MVLLVYVQPLLSITSSVYVPAVKPVITNPVCEPTFGLQLYVNGGSPLYIKTSISPSLPVIGCVVDKSKNTPVDAEILKFCVCEQPLKSVTVAI